MRLKQFRATLCLVVFAFTLHANQEVHANIGFGVDNAQALRDFLIARENALYDQLVEDSNDNTPFGRPMLAAYGEWIDVDASRSAKNMDSESVSLWLESTYLVFFHSLNANIFKQGKDLFRELESRNAAELIDVRRIVEMAIGAREFAFANQLINTHAELNIDTLPAIEYDEKFDEDLPAVFHVNGNNSSLIASNITFDNGKLRLLFIFHPHCNFSRKAAKELQSIDHFDCFSSRHGDWLAPMHFQDESRAISSWNTANPESLVKLVYNPTSWQPIYFTETPTFYLLEGDKVLSSVHGWRPDSTPAAVSDMLATFLSQSELEDCQSGSERASNQ